MNRNAEIKMAIQLQSTSDKVFAELAATLASAGLACALQTSAGQSFVHRLAQDPQVKALPGRIAHAVVDSLFPGGSHGLPLAGR
jgi:hypothetical protein